MKYRPYLIDWRFLPEPLLKLKDYVRFLVNSFGDSRKGRGALGALWLRTIRPGVLASIRRSGKLFVHIPRAGGTSISCLLYGHNLPHLPTLFYKEHFSDIAKLPSFAVVRSPVERAVSAFCLLQHGGTSIMAASRYDPLHLQDRMSFSEFLCRIEAQPKLAESYDSLREQVSFVTGADGGLIVDRLFSVSSADGFSAGLSDFLGGLPIPHLNTAVTEKVAVFPCNVRVLERLYWKDFLLYNAVCESGGELSRIATLESTN